MTDLPRGTIGWFDYNFKIPEAGWRKLVVNALGGVGRLELDIDAPKTNEAKRGQYRAGDWVWLTAGNHRLRLITNYWTGLPQSVTSIRLESPAHGQPGGFYLLPNWENPVSAIGSCAPVRFLAGGSNKELHLLMFFTDTNGSMLKSESITVPPSLSPQSFERPIPCLSAGQITATLRASGEVINEKIEAKQDFWIIDNSPAKASFEIGKLVVDVNASDSKPDYQSGDSEVVDIGGVLRYRESSDRGTLALSRRRTTTPASWFAYDVKELGPGKAYLFHVEYPDDKDRVFIAAFRQANETSYPVSLGMETGGVWPLSEKMMTRSAIVWPTSSDGRVILYNYFDGQKAPLARYAFYEINENIESVAAPHLKHDGLRDVAYYSEEGINFKMLVGGSDKVPPKIDQFDRYARLAAASGASLIIPTVVVYASQLYPSRYNLTFQDWGADATAEFLLTAQKYGLDVVPELAPRADELIWLAQTQEDIENLLLISKSGEMRLVDADGKILRPPYYNSLSPTVRRWYADMIGELAERYKAYPNFKGIQLRLTDWQNPALNNLVSLDWGYDKDTVSRFLKDRNLSVTSLSLTSNSAESVRARHAYLTSSTMREEWVTWRCEKIRDLLQNIVSRVRGARSDLKVHLFFFALSGHIQPDRKMLREMGIDINLLQEIEGLVLVDGRFQHGAKEQSVSWQKYMRTGAVNADGAGLFSTKDQRASTLYPMQYMEITGSVTPNVELGWSAALKSPWVSASSEPPGRLKLERYAKLVGLHDVFMIGDGGNGYVFADEQLIDFFNEFRSLPRRPFEKDPKTAEDIVVRRNGDILYIVNLSNVSRKVEIDVPGVRRVVRLTTGVDSPCTNGKLVLDLEAYQLRVFKTITKI